MKKLPIQEVHYHAPVWVNPTVEPQRREECMCLHCGRLKPGSLQNCPTAQQFFQVCCANNVALIITRCPDWTPEQGE